MKQEKISGIYCIKNIINNKKYIGLSNDIYRRWNEHRRNLRNNCHKNYHLQNAWNKYGELSFNFNIIEESSSDNIRNLEKYYIKKYQTQNPKYGYNMTLGGDGGNTIINYSPEKLKIHNDKVSKIHKQTAPKGENASNVKLNNSQVREICNLLSNGVFSSDIAKKYNVHINTVDDIFYRRTWVEISKKYEFPSHKSNKNRTCGEKPVKVFDLNGNYIKTFLSCHEAERQTGIGFRMISRVCRGDRPYTHGFIFKYA